MNAALKLPGLSNAWTMPIKGRIDMLTTGIRTPIGIKISGADVAEIDRIGSAIEWPTSHSPFVSRPDLVTGRLLDLSSS
mgnify:CR=1 FL=1